MFSPLCHVLFFFPFFLSFSSSNHRSAYFQCTRGNRRNRKGHLERFRVSTRVTFNVTPNVPDVVGMSKMGGDSHVSLYS